MYNILFSDNALKQFKKLEKIIQERIINTIERVRIRPESFVIKLLGEPYYKLRVGDYRLIIDIQYSTQILCVIKVGHRRDIYDF